MIRTLSHSEAGGHAENEDAFDIRTHPDAPECLLVAVADGQGGRAGAGMAARLACKICLDAASSLTPAKLFLPSTWVTILATADEAVSAEPAAGFTTLIGFFVAGDWLCGASSGDSAVYYLSSGKKGEVITERQHKDPPVGSGAANFVPFGAQLQRPWIVLAMTDGAWKYAGWDTLCKVAAEQRDDAVIGRVLDRARLPRSGGLQDDFTLVVLSRG